MRITFIHYLTLILLFASCNDVKNEFDLNEIEAFKQDVVVFVPDTFEYEKLPYPKIDSSLFIKYFASIPELKQYSDHTSSVFVYSKNELPYGMKGIVLMTQDDMFMKQYYLIVLNKENKIRSTYLIAFSSIDTEWYDVTNTSIVGDSVLKTNKVSCEILSHVDTVNYCACDSVNVTIILKPTGLLIKNKEQTYQYKRRYN